MSDEKRENGTSHEPNKVIDLDKVRARATIKQVRRRRKRLLIGAIVAAVLLLVGAFLWLQVREVFVERTFWDNLGQVASAG